MQHTIDTVTSWRAGTLTPPRRAKPAGMPGAGMIRAATVRERFPRLDGPPPVDPGELEFLAVDPLTTYRVKGSHAGALDARLRRPATATIGA